MNPASLLLTALALATTTQAKHFPKFEAASPEVARAQVSQSIERQGRWDVWENLSSGRTPELRHRQSGALCRFWADKVFLSVWTDYFSPSTPVGPGEAVNCSTWLDLKEGGRLSFETRIAAATFALDGKAYRFFDGEGTPARVLPEYLAWRTAYWNGVRLGPVVHEQMRMIRGPGGASVPVYGVRTTTYGPLVSRSLTVMIGGWTVTQWLTAPAAHETEALELALAQLEYTVSTLDRPHPGAAQQEALVTAQRSAEAQQPPGASSGIALVARNAFQYACVAPRRQNKPYTPDQGWKEWQPVDAPPGLPRIRDEGPAKAWLVEQGPGGRVYVHYDAAMTGDCAVSVYGADAEQTWRGLEYLLVRGTEAPFARGAYPIEARGRYSETLEGRGWAAEGSLMASKDPGDRPSVFLGLRGAPRPR